jgi:hypothetical protein
MASKKAEKPSVLPTRTLPMAFFEEASPDEIAALIQAQGLEKSSAVVACLLKHYGPVLGDTADRIVERAQKNPEDFAKDLLLGAAKHMFRGH